MNAKSVGAILFLSASLQAAEVTVFVGPGGEAKTVEEGIAKLRAKRKGNEPGRLFISGTQFLTKPLVLTEADSGLEIEGATASDAVAAPSRPNRPYGGRRAATLSGGRILEGWKRGQGNLWEVEIPDIKQGKWYFRELFVNGERRQRARTPNTGYFRIDGASSKDKPFKLHFKPGDIKKSWADAGDVEVIARIAWTDIHMFIRNVDESANIATLSTFSHPAIQEANAQYFIENAPDGLDAPGEWQLNRKTGVLSYWPMPNEKFPDAEVIAPVLEELVTVRGNADSKKAAEKIAFRNLTFAHTDYNLPTDGIADAQAAVSVRGDLLFEFAKDCVIEDCLFTHLGGYGIEVGRGGQGIKIRNSEVADVGGGGIRIGETTRRSDPFDENHSNEVTDCDLHTLGRVFAPAVGVFILQSGTNLVSHNHIHDLYYTAVSVGWNWGYQETPCRKNLIEFNHMHDIGQFLLSDMGAVYTLGIQRGTVIQNNLIHDVNSFTYGGWGLYTDEGSSDILLQNNVVYRCKSAGFHQHYGRDNIIRNNIFAFGKEHQLMRSREEDHNSFTFENNIVYYDSGDLLGSYWSNDHYAIDRNVYFDARPGVKVTFTGATLEQWQARGHDKNSVIGDPLFFDAAKFDFRLRPESPALRMGFRPIDVSTVGPRKNH
jgi:hypothetical protein